MDIIRFLPKLYREYQLRQIYKDFYANATIGNKFELSLSAKIRNESGSIERILIGDYCKIYGAIVCKKDATVNIGDFTVLQNGTSLCCLSGIKIGSFVGIAEGTLITDNNTHSTEIHKWIEHRIRAAPGGQGYPGLGNGWEESESKQVIIGNAVWIGANCSILKGVTVGDGSIIARGSVVVKNVEPFTIVAGNPARKVKQLVPPEEDIQEIASKFIAKYHGN